MKIQNFHCKVIQGKTTSEAEAHTGKFLKVEAMKVSTGLN